MISQKDHDRIWLWAGWKFSDHDSWFSPSGIKHACIPNMTIDTVCEYIVPKLIGRIDFMRFYPYDAGKTWMCDIQMGAGRNTISTGDSILESLLSNILQIIYNDEKFEEDRLRRKL